MKDRYLQPDKNKNRKKEEEDAESRYMEMNNWQKRKLLAFKNQNRV